MFFCGQDQVNVNFLGRTEVVFLGHQSIMPGSTRYQLVALLVMVTDHSIKVMSVGFSIINTLIFPL